MKIIGSVLCWLGFHRWDYNKRTIGGRFYRWCKRCNKQQDEHYDMTYGCTYYE